jgi:hypothetical protein
MNAPLRQQLLKSLRREGITPQIVPLPSPEKAIATQLKRLGCPYEPGSLQASNWLEGYYACLKRHVLPQEKLS